MIKHVNDKKTHSSGTNASWYHPDYGSFAHGETNPQKNNGVKAGGIRGDEQTLGMPQLARWEAAPPLRKASQPMGFLSVRRAGNGLALV
ncbi:hypothetical protein M3223_21555 [Paenibacillus pasadenensis]|nr:hypothetical protein [Paenibacillus pasadenensis]